MEVVYYLKIRKDREVLWELKLQEMSLSRSSLLRNPIYDMNLYVHS